MTVKQAAESWGISRYQVNAYIKQKRVEATRRFKDSRWWWEIPDNTPKPEPKPWSGGRPKKQKETKQ